MAYEKLYTYEGETLNISQWARRVGISLPTLSRRLGKMGWPIDKALTVPTYPMKKSEKKADQERIPKYTIMFGPKNWYLHIGQEDEKLFLQAVEDPEDASLFSKDEYLKVKDMPGFPRNSIKLYAGKFLRSKHQRSCLSTRF